MTSVDVCIVQGQDITTNCIYKTKSEIVLDLLLDSERSEVQHCPNLLSKTIENYIPNQACHIQCILNQETWCNDIAFDLFDLFFAETKSDC